MNLFFILRLIGLFLMLFASLFFCYLPYRRLTIITEKLERLSGRNVRYMDLFKHLFNLTNCQQLSWSIWDECNDERHNVTRRRQLPFANCQLIYESLSCNCGGGAIGDIQQIDEHSYIYYGCLPGINRQLAMLLINSTIINVTAKSLSTVLIEPCTH